MQPRHPLLCCCCCSRGDALTTDSWIMNRYSYKACPTGCPTSWRPNATLWRHIFRRTGPPPQQAARSLCGEVEATTAMGICLRMLCLQHCCTATKVKTSAHATAVLMRLSPEAGFMKGLSQFDDLESMVVRGIACTISDFLRKHS